MEKETLKAIQVICSLLLGDKNPSVITYNPQKTEIPKRTSRYFKRSVPEKHGVSSVRIQNFLSELEENEHCNIHSVMILKDGAVISEAYAPGFDSGIPHLSHSMSKTVTGIAVAILADEEKLHTGTTVSEIFTEYKFPPELAGITVLDLLQMSAGLSFSESGSITSEAWTEDFFNSSIRFAHGEGFLYNSMNSYILASAVEHLSGESFGSFVRTRLFEPLKIKNYFWEKGPEGTEKGGWGLYLAPEDWLKIATLFITGGKFEGKTVISHISMLEFILTRNAHSKDNNRDFDYAGHINMRKDTSALLFNGLFGQNVYIDPALKLAVAINAGNSDLFKSGATLDIILKYFPPDLADARLSLLVRWRSARALSRQERAFFASRSFIPTNSKRHVFRTLLRGASSNSHTPFDWDEMLGKYSLPKNNVSLLPVIQRILQNNLAGGIEALEILESDGLLLFRFTTGAEVWKIYADKNAHVENKISFGGELYRVNAIAGTAVIDNVKIYKLELVFPELPNSRKITLRRSENGTVEMVFEETPSVETVLPWIKVLICTSNMVNIALSMIERKLGQGFVERKIRELFSPSFILPLDTSPEKERILYEENERIDKERREILSVPFISAFIKKSIEENDTSEALPTKRRGFLSFLAGLFREALTGSSEGKDA